MLGKKSNEIITYNKATAPFQNEKNANQTDIRKQYDPVSFLNPFQAKNGKEITIKNKKDKILDVIGNHQVDSLPVSKGDGMKYIQYNDEEVIFEGDLEKHQCIGLSKNGQQCRRHQFLNLPYCFMHMKSVLHLKVKTSTIENAGKGLFADNGSNDNEIVFRKDDIICKYCGDDINENELVDRYGDYTGAYAIQVKNNLYEDAALYRGVGSMVNHTNNKTKINCRFSTNYREITIKATKNIRNGSELLISYGNEYLFDSQNKTIRTKS